MPTLLITRPEYEQTTRYISRWSECIIEESKRRKFDLIDLIKEKANSARFLGTLKKKAGIKALVVINGHGNDAEIAGQDHKTLISSRDANLLHAKIVYARACSSVNVLGKKAVREGALAYIGYDVPFTFYIENENISKPREDKTAELFLEPSNHVPISLIKGHSAGEANLRSRNKFIQNIRRLLVDGPTSPYFYTLNALYYNMAHQVCLGDKEAKL